MNFDVVIVGAGPSGLIMAIRLAQLAQQQERELTICILEKGAEVGAHILSGAVIETRSLDELIPDWKDRGARIRIEQKDVSHLGGLGDGRQPLPVAHYVHRHGLRGDVVVP